MRTLLVIAVALTGLAVAVPGPNDDPLRTLVPYLNEQTYVAGTVDLRNVDFEPMLAALQTAGMPKSTLAWLKKEAGPVRDALSAAGGRSIGFVLSFEDLLLWEPLFIIAVPADGKPQAIANLFKNAPFEAKIKDGTVLVGTPARLEAALRSKAGAAPELSNAFAAVAASPTRLVATIPPILRKSVEETMPTLPEQLGGGSSAVLTRGLRWIALGANLAAGKQELNLIVQADNAESAGKLDRLGQRVLELAKKTDLAAWADGLQELRPQVKADQLRLTLDANQLKTVVLPMLVKIRASGDAAQTRNNLKQLALAMHNFHDVNKAFPAQARYSPQKKPLLSWRVALLPYLDELKLYKQFKLDEPWDSPANKPWLEKMPEVFRSPLRPDLPPGKTVYQVPVGPGLIFDGPKQTKLLDIFDGTSNTILLVHTNDAHAVWWTQPADYTVNKQMPKAGLLRAKEPDFLVALADGSVRTMPRTISDATLWLWFDPSDGTPIPEN